MQKLKITNIFGYMGVLETATLPHRLISVFRNVFYDRPKKVVIFFITIMYYSRETSQQYIYSDCITY